jgi:hydrogenase maturation protease
MSDPSRTLVLGLGNPLMGDDGLGLVALQSLREEWELPETIDLVDGGTWGMNLLPLIEDARELLLLDAIRHGAAPGTLVVLGRAGLPRYFAHKISPHQIDLKEVLGLAELRGRLPARASAVGLEPERVELGLELSATLAERVGDVTRAAAHILQRWGHRCERRVLTGHA